MRTDLQRLEHRSLHGPNIPVLVLVIIIISIYVHSLFLSKGRIEIPGISKKDIQMHATALLVLLTFVRAATADSLPAPSLPLGVFPAQRFRRSSNSHERRKTHDLPPAILCGPKYTDCGDGWCCSANQKCVGEVEGIPVCKGPTVTSSIPNGTILAKPYDDLNKKFSTLSRALETMTDLATNSVLEKQTGAASSTGSEGFGSMAALVVGLWGVAAIGGAGIFFL